MEIRKLMEIQKDFDTQHGWTLKNDESRELLKTINKDLIGLFGEIGEFANIIKKLNIEIEKSEEKFEEIFPEFQESLDEELIDSFIYLLRIATHLQLDLESAYLKKLSLNKEKFKKYEDS